MHDSFLMVFAQLFVLNSKKNKKKPIKREFKEINLYFKYLILDTPNNKKSSV